VHPDRRPQFADGGGKGKTPYYAGREWLLDNFYLMKSKYAPPETFAKGVQPGTPSPDKWFIAGLPASMTLHWK